MLYLGRAEWPYRAPKSGFLPTRRTSHTTEEAIPSTRDEIHQLFAFQGARGGESLLATASCLAGAVCGHLQVEANEVAQD